MSAPKREAPVSREELEVAVEARRELSVEHEFDPGAIGVAVGSVALGIPVTAVAGDAAGLAGVIVAWIGIVLVNVAYSRSTR